MSTPLKPPSSATGIMGNKADTPAAVREKQNNQEKDDVDEMSAGLSDLTIASVLKMDGLSPGLQRFVEKMSKAKNIIVLVGAGRFPYILQHISASN